MNVKWAYGFVPVQPVHIQYEFFVSLSLMCRFGLLSKLRLVSF